MPFTMEKIAIISNALSDPIRLRILNLVKIGYEQLPISPSDTCQSGGICVCDIQDALNMPQSKISYHLKELKQAELLKETKQGKRNFYAINTNTLRTYQESIAEYYLTEKKGKTHDI
ncbi:ArsR/SmtB family transcription factor [Shimazuella kribbensis]|uniref:ArsR/SmtB family transcription factor n=1 Tax=Shimazuella kribbensis TaxID=139808 RepID=UPI0004012771|nr:metalloregulator ArsR/SmtB family transcription factor [Shimazuella kribbensis]